MSGPGKSDEISEAFGMDGHQISPNEFGGEHHTVYNDVTHISWDYDKDGNYVSDLGNGKESHHEDAAPNTSWTPW